MLRQALLVPSRALGSSTRSIAQRPLSRAQTFISPIAAARRIQPAVARWYSDAPKESQEGEKKEGDADAKPTSDSQAAVANEDPLVAELKKKLETKDKEAAEWKVRGA